MREGERAWQDVLSLHKKKKKQELLGKKAEGQDDVSEDGWPSSYK